MFIGCLRRMNRLIPSGTSLALFTRMIPSLFLGRGRRCSIPYLSPGTTTQSLMKAAKIFQNMSVTGSIVLPVGCLNIDEDLAKRVFLAKDTWILIICLS